MSMLVLRMLVLLLLMLLLMSVRFRFCTSYCAAPSVFYNPVSSSPLGTPRDKSKR